MDDHSPQLKRELGLWDLVFTQILFIVGLGWVGAEYLALKRATCGGADGACAP